MGIRRRTDADAPTADAGDPAGRAHQPDERNVGQIVDRSKSRWRLRNWRLRPKLVVVLLVPMLTAVFLGGLRVIDQLRDAQGYDAISQEVALGARAADVFHELLLEREQVVLYVASKKAAGAGPGSAQTQRVDASVAAFKRQAASSASIAPSMRSTVDAALSSLDGLGALRTANDGTAHPEIAVSNGYNTIVAALQQASQITQVTSVDPRIFQVAQGLDAVRIAEDQYTQGNAILAVAAQQGSFPPGWLDVLRSTTAQFDAAIHTFTTVASPADRQLYTTTFAGPAVDDRARLQQSAQVHAEAGVHADTGQSLGITAADVVRAGDGAATLIHNAELTIAEELRSLTADSYTAALRQALWDGAIIAFALLLALSLAGVVAESLVASLKRLRAGAIDVARSRLPRSVERILADDDPISASERAVEPVPVFSADEIGEVARSFDLVHSQAVRLAAEQAVLRDNVNTIFVNLSRRSQTLVERQLALIDQLERDEQDPDQLANLFELDHLATRMRRNSESLLVLSGSGLASRMSQPVKIGDLVGAAVSEVEQYTRIDLGSPPDVAVVGRAVNDLIHLIAELLDNATAYSEPSTKVYVRIAGTKARELAIQVTDRGVGMPEADMRRHNDQLANPPDIDVGVTRRMGLYVVARLAQRHGIRVKLRANEDIDGGTVALVVIPANLVVWPGDDPAGPMGIPAGIRATSPGPVTGGQPAAATTASGIASAFGRAVPRGAPVVGEPSAEHGTDASLEPATAFWSTNFEPEREIAQRSSSGDTSGGEVESVSLFHSVTGMVEEEAENSVEPSAEPSPVLSAPPPTNGWSFAAAEPETAANADDAAADYPQPERPVAGADVELDAPTERLPIYEAVLSQWFRAEARPATDEAVDASAVDVSGAAPHLPPSGGQELVPSSVEPSQKPRPRRTRTTSAGRRGAAKSAPSPEPPAVPAESVWRSPADEGWQAAEALLNNRVSEVTPAGLPKRVPRAHLVPGSATPEPPPSEPVATVSLPPRSADAVRNRMSSFQEGVRRGRNVLIEAYPGGASESLQGRPHEEHE